MQPQTRTRVTAAAIVSTIALTFGGVGLVMADSTNPTQQEALEGLETARRYIEQHPGTPLPTATPTGTPSATQTASPSATATTPPATTTKPPTTTSAPPVSPFPSGLPWSSGVYADHDAAAASAFATMRGRAVDNIVVFPSRDSFSAMLNTWWLSGLPAGFPNARQDIVVSVPLWPQNSSVGANNDANWQAFARALAARDANAYVRLGWEMNIGQFWKVTAANRTQWIAAFNRAVVAMKSVAPNLRIVWNPNWGNDQTDTDTRGVFLAVKANVDVYAIDIYDSYPPDLSDNQAQQRLNGSRGLQDSLNFAKTNGKQFAIPEWGVACNGSGCQWAGNAGGDNPRYIRDTLNFLAANRTAVAFDSYFNEPASYIRSNLTGSTNPQAAAAYRAALAALAS